MNDHLCATCRNAVPIGAKFCPHCGSPLSLQSSHPASRAVGELHPKTRSELPSQQPPEHSTQAPSQGFLGTRLRQEEMINVAVPTILILVCAVTIVGILIQGVTKFPHIDGPGDIREVFNWEGLVTSIFAAGMIGILSLPFIFVVLWIVTCFRKNPGRENASVPDLPPAPPKPSKSVTMPTKTIEPEDTSPPHSTRPTDANAVTPQSPNEKVWWKPLKSASQISILLAVVSRGCTWLIGKPTISNEDVLINLLIVGVVAFIVIWIVGILAAAIRWVRSKKK